MILVKQLFVAARNTGNVFCLGTDCSSECKVGRDVACVQRDDSSYLLGRLIRATRTNRENPKAKAEYDSVRALLGTTSELDRRCEANNADFFITDEDLI